MSCPIDVYFVRDNEFVGVGHGNLGFVPDDKNIPSAIFDAWHTAVEFFEDEPECGLVAMTRFKEHYGHLFTTRERLFEYQFVMIPRCNIIVSRQIVHDLLTQRLSTEQFVEHLTERVFDLQDRQWEAIAERTRIRGMMTGHETASEADIVRAMREWRIKYDVTLEAHIGRHLGYYLNWSRGKCNLDVIKEVVLEYNDF